MNGQSRGVLPRGTPDYPFLPDGSALICDPLSLTSKTSCHTCLVSYDKSDQVLRQCTGCAVARYCSKECQKQAWPDHKFFCRQTNATRALHHELVEITRRLTPEPDNTPLMDVPIAGFASFSKFCAMHSWTLKTICQASMHVMADGRGAEYFRQTPYVVRFVGTATPHQGRRPWNSWGLRLSRQPVRQFIKSGTVFARMWEDAMSQYAEQRERNRARYGDRYIGEMPAIFYVEGTNISHVVLYPIVALHNPDALQSRRKRAAVEDLVRLCIAHASAGIPLQPRDEDDAFADPVRVFRDRETRQWVYRLLGTPDEPFPANHLKMMFGPNPRKSDLHPRDLMRVYSRLW